MCVWVPNKPTMIDILVLYQIAFAELITVRSITIIGIGALSKVVNGYAAMMMCNRFVSDPWEQTCQNIIFENSKSCRKLWPLCWPVKTILFREKNVLLNVSVLELDSWGQTGNLQPAESLRIFWTNAKFCFTNQSTIAKLHKFHWTFTDFPLENLIQTWLRFLTQIMGCFLWSSISLYLETYFSLKVTRWKH